MNLIAKLSVVAPSLIMMSSLGWSAPRKLAGNPIHIDLEASGYEYRDSQDETKSFVETENARLQEILDIGKRNLQWVDYINSLRPSETQILLSSAETQVGYPITSPTVNNEQIVIQEFDTWKSGLSADIRDVYFSTVALPQNPGVSDDDFVVISRKIDRIYQRASRWLLQVPYLTAYKQAAKEDLRGYYSLNSEANLQQSLKNWDVLLPEIQTKYKAWLIGQCFNDEKMTKAVCQTKLTQAIQNQSVWEFHSVFHAKSEELYNQYFLIPEFRSDVTWDSSNPNLMSIPFANPKMDNVLNWLRDNIEDEWKWMGWQLKLNFIDTTSADTTHIEFKEGATPHVNGIAGSIITMDGNRNLTEYSSRWTIRHEYGHVLGFPDCYLEFYDESVSAMISYQLDITNLMCSRRGKLQQKHFDELKRVYFKK